MGAHLPEALTRLALAFAPHSPSAVRRQQRRETVARAGLRCLSVAARNGDGPPEREAVVGSKGRESPYVAHGVGESPYAT
jgi:hypothetical protein